MIDPNQVERLLESLDDSNTVSSLKNERAARMIRDLLYEWKMAERQRDEAQSRINQASAYLYDRSWSNNVIPKALVMLGTLAPERLH